jgi:hypothetical protein
VIGAAVSQTRCPPGESSGKQASCAPPDQVENHCLRQQRRVREHPLGRRRTHPARQPFEQGKAKPALRLPDFAAERRSGDRRPGLGDGDTERVCPGSVAGAEAFLVLREDDARAAALPFARRTAAVDRHNRFPDDPVMLRGGWPREAGGRWAMARVAPGAVDRVHTCADDPVVSAMQFKNPGLCPPGEIAGFPRARDFTRTGDLPHNTGGVSFRRARPTARAATWDSSRRCASSPARAARGRWPRRGARSSSASG